MRLALEREAIYASEFPFIEYGIDLAAMAELDKGLRTVRITGSDYDTMPPPKEKAKVDHYLYTMKNRKADRIPVEL